jgi:uncharacterized protein YbaR (Trm112 family)
MPKGLPKPDPVAAFEQRRSQGAGVPPLPADFLAFLEAHIRVKFSGEVLPWSAQGHEYLVEPLLDPAAEKAAQKGTQLGVSTGIVALCLWRAGGAGWHVGYHLPTDAHVKTFVQLRVDPIINLDRTDTLPRLVVAGDPLKELGEFAKRRNKGADNITLKQVGRGWNLYLGCENVNDVISFDYDLAVLDELDELKAGIASQIGERLLHSKIAHQIAISRPALPGLGINGRYEAGDQRRWMLRCAKCRRWSNLEDSWPECLVRVDRVSRPDDAWRIVCPHCKSRLPYLERREPGTAEYVATHPGRQIASWRISQLYGPAMTADRAARLWEKAQKRREDLESFTRAVLGKPFAGERQPVSQDVFSRACNPAVPLSLSQPFLSTVHGSLPPAVYAGLDVGDTLHLTLLADLGAEGLQVFWCERLGWGEAAARLAAVRPAFFMVDGRPEHSESIRLCRRFFRGGAVCYFSQGVQQTLYGVEGPGGLVDGVIDLRDPEAVLYAKAARDDVLDDLTSEIANGALRFPALKHAEVELVGRHFQNLVKDIQGDPPRWRYQSGLENHYAFSTLYALLAREMATRLHLGPAMPIAGQTLTVKREEHAQQW